MMTREQVEKCSKYEQAFKWALRSNFVRMSQGEFNDVAALAKEIIGKTMTKSQMTCNTCRLSLLKELGKAYYDSRDKYLKEDREKEKETDEKPKKKGRPKKIDIDQE